MNSRQTSWGTTLKKEIELRTLHVRNRYLLFIDALSLPLAAYFAFVLRMDLNTFDVGQYRATAFVFASVALVVKVTVLLMLDGYSRYWPFASMPELDLIIRAILLGEMLTTGIALTLLQALHLPSFPRSIPLLDLLLATFAVAGPRMALRWLYYHMDREKTRTTRTLKRVLIVGAGEGGYMTLQEIRRNPTMGLQPVGFVDDDPDKHGMLLGGEARVLGSTADIPAIVRAYRVQQILIAIPTATSAQMRRIVAICQQAEVDVLTLPGVYELITGQVHVQRFRPVELADLLARDPVQTDTAKVAALLADRYVLVTGAGGSIGSELCRQIAQCQPSALLLLGHGENSIYHIHGELRERFPDLEIHPIIADIRDAARIDQVFAQYRPDFVFHAAAHKHVPLMEYNPLEAVTNNVGGTWTLVQAAQAHDTAHFVLISTDKAVNPTSMMGATKRVAEHIVRAAAQRTGRGFEAVRFGNVLGSRGSVVPLFQKQIAAGGPVTVTHPEVRRYFMTIPEAVQLVLQAATLGRGSEVFVLDMGEPVKILDLARDMIHLAGLREGRDIDIVFTGLRPGEKLCEELFTPDETHACSLHRKIFFAQNGHVSPDSLEAQVERLLATAAQGDRDATLAHLQALVPAYNPDYDASPTPALERQPLAKVTERPPLRALSNLKADVV